MKYFALLLLLLYQTVYAEPLGRLFFTPAERAAMERPSKPVAETKPRAEPVTVQLNGIVQKHGGPRTIWINGQAQQQNHEQAADQATLPIAGTSVQLHVGQHTRVEP